MRSRAIYPAILAIGLLTFSCRVAHAIRPEARYLSTPSHAGLAYDSLNIPTSDGYRLTGWYCKPDVDTAHTVIVLAGGDAGNMSYDISLAWFLVNNFNVSVLLFDYRGFGTSQPFAFDSSAIGEPEYLTDLDAAVSYAAKHYAKRKIILYGRSLGGSLAIVEGSKRKGIIGVIAESPYVSQRLLKQHFDDKSINPRSDTVSIVETNDLEPMARIANFQPRNFLLLHGAKEKFILSSEEKTLFNAVPASNKQFVDFAGCDHLEAPFKATQEFGNTMQAFLASTE